MTRMFRCPNCVGTGSIESSDSTDDSWWDCARCNGTGEIEDRRIASFDFDKLREQNASRRDRWHAGGEEWTCSDWSNALAGEVGEACNIVKKIRRHETHVDRIAGGEGPYNTPELGVLKARIADEIADVILYADHLAAHFEIDVGEAVRSKFNRVSEAQGFPERL